MIKYDYELLTILSKILCYQDDKKDSYSINFILEYYKVCKCYIEEKNNIIEYFSLYFNLIDIKDDSALLKMKILLGYPKLIIKPEYNRSNFEQEENYFYSNIYLNELSQRENLTIGEEIDNEILENEMNMNFIGEQLIKNNKGDIQTYIYDYNNNHISDGRVIGFLTELFYHEDILKDSKNELFYFYYDA